MIPSTILSRFRMALSGVTLALLACPAFAQVNQDMMYYTGTDDIPADVCAGRADGRDGLPAGRIHGSFHVDPSLQLAPRHTSNPLFSVGIDESRRLSREMGGNAFYHGDLVAWEETWLLCVKGHSPHFSWLDLSKPLLKIVPIAESLNDDGYYQRVSVQHYWHPTDRKHSLPTPQDHLWIMDDL